MKDDSLNTNFLYKEYEQCFKQMRFYDERQTSYVKFAITLTSSIATILLAVYKLSGENTTEFWLFQSYVCFIVFIGICLIVISMVQNRLYFIYPAKQVNAIRKYLLANEITEFKTNQMYLSTKFSPFKLLSTQTIMIFSVAFLECIHFGVGVLSILLYKGVSYLIQTTIFWTIMVFVIQITIISVYLSLKGKKKADEAVH